jgi:hypothetical protein
MEWIDQPNLDIDYAKEVRTIYPFAFCFEFNKAFAIIEWTREFSEQKDHNSIPLDVKFYCRWQDAVSIAWKAAWERIQYDMLKKFEE